MKSRISKFKLVDRGFKDTLVLIPGWATDYRIFSTLDINYNYLLAVEFYPFGFNEGLVKSLKEKSITKISLFGWSLGAFLAQDFALIYPQVVNELILLSIRKKYAQKSLEEIKSQILKNKKAFLYKFYLRLFSDDDKDAAGWFKRALLKNYISEMKRDELTEGLDYLSQSHIQTDSLAGFKRLRIFHGGKDSVAPLSEACEIKDSLPLAEFINIAATGHIPFLSKEFKARFCNG